MPISAMLLHTFYIHQTIYTESGSGFSKKFRIPKNSNPDPKSVAVLRIWLSALSLVFAMVQEVGCGGGGGVAQLVESSYQLAGQVKRCN